MLNHPGQPAEPDPHNSTTAQPWVGAGPASLKHFHLVTSMGKSRAGTATDQA